ncbi:hypothetical protein FQR65_LT15084 [Abscondita terminalis]|nr:hypothetical protein FQR65_LT15084 [Abscondita terminalis]
MDAEDEYSDKIKAIRGIIKGDYKIARQYLTSQMMHFAGKNGIRERPDDESAAYVNYFKINNGSIVQSFTTEIKKVLEESDEEIMEEALVEIRQKFGSNSKEIYLPFHLSVEIPGAKKLLYRRNAEKNLRMPVEPDHIEAFDNSNISGLTKSSCRHVWYLKDVNPVKQDYRIFHVKKTVGRAPMDFATMEEVILRRYSRLLDEGEDLPQLILIDGGKGQLSSAVKSLKTLGLYGKITIVGIAKRLEEIFFPEDPIPLYLDKKSETLKILQRVRDEAHRFGVKHHRTRRKTSTIKQKLEEIPGVGPKSIEIFCPK